MPTFKVTVIWEERRTADMNIVAEDAEQARDYAYEEIQERGFPETDDTETTSLDFEVETEVKE